MAGICIHIRLAKKHLHVCFCLIAQYIYNLLTLGIAGAFAIKSNNPISVDIESSLKHKMANCKYYCKTNSYRGKRATLENWKWILFVQKSVIRQQQTPCFRFSWHLSLTLSLSNIGNLRPDLGWQQLNLSQREKRWNQAQSKCAFSGRKHCFP